MGFGTDKARQVLVSQPQTGPLDKQEMIKDNFIALIVNSIITVLNFYIGTSCTYLWAFRPKVDNKNATYSLFLKSEKEKIKTYL